MDGLVLVFAAILNPRAERSAQCGELRLRDTAHDAPRDGGTAIATAVVPAAAGQNEQNPVTNVPSMDFAPCKSLPLSCMAIDLKHCNVLL
jgi:hypothetical protein